MRELVAGLAWVTAAAAAVVQVVEGPPGSGYGWGSVVVSAVLLATPLVAMGLMVRAGERRFVWPVIVLAVLMVAVVLMALFGNWSGQPPTDRVLDSIVTCLVLATSLGAVVVEAGLLRRRPGP